MRHKIGVDIGSTTIKMVALDAADRLVFEVYRRHQMKVCDTFVSILRQLRERVGDVEVSLTMTGSVGMGVAERLSLPFVQEVVAATNYIHAYHPEVTTMIDIGGEDAKMVFFNNGEPEDLRMNGNCAGGTGAFIDQMAVLLNVSPEELGELAERAERIYPIASRCGVFCKTDIQNLIARNVAREDIAASIFHAVAVQTVITLAHGHDIAAPVLLCGGPLTFIPALRKAFENHLQLPTTSFVLPPKANLLPAWGTALSVNGTTMTISELEKMLEESMLQDRQRRETSHATPRLAPIFADEAEYEGWKREKQSYAIGRKALQRGVVNAFLGIDSGSTTTKIVVLDDDEKILFSFYKNNNGDPISAVKEGLNALLQECESHGTQLFVSNSCSTGYGEDLIKAAFRLDNGIVETMAHYMAAKRVSAGTVSFILDIGGQDMKAIFVENNAISRIEVNEACSSGCGSFISTFAQSLDSGIAEFAEAACMAHYPCDLGTRCTVFMNSKVKQVLREGASAADIAAGLSYSVVKNCLHKVLRLKSMDELGDNIVVQGGTMRNDSIVRALEKLTGKSVFRSDCPELMGALGCALYAHECAKQGASVALTEILSGTHYTTRQQSCHGCENQCTITRYLFDNNNTFYSGNRCEKVFSNKGRKADQNATTLRPKNAYEKKRQLLFDRPTGVTDPVLTIGIPRGLGMFEDYPFWHCLFTECNIRVELSHPSDYVDYERCAGKVMSDNICFPAKLVHSHIDDLVSKGVDRIFLPFVVYEHLDPQMQNSYNCPIVTGYSEVVKSVQTGDVPIDTPTISFKERRTLRLQCREYLKTLGCDISSATFKGAFQKAIDAQEQYENAIAAYNQSLLAEARSAGRMAIVLAGRPYHADPLIQHKVSEMVTAQGVYVLTDDLVRDLAVPDLKANYLSQWAYANRIFKAARWCATQGDDVQFMQLTSFGCGPDAFLVDEIRTLLLSQGKSLTLLKIDDVNNIGSLKLRVRSFIESLHIGRHQDKRHDHEDASIIPYTKKERKRKIIIPFFTPYISPLLPSLVRLAGYEAENLPISDAESCDWGLKFSNNEICYPATLIVGDIIKAFRTGKYNPDETCVAMTQTGGQCRASNYISLIRKALIENGYTNTPVISVAFGSGISNSQNQPGFKVDWLKMMPIALAAIMYSDTIAKLYHATIVRTSQPEEARRLRDTYLQTATIAIDNNQPDALYDTLSRAAADFDRLCRAEECPKVGIVGEIFLKFHPFAQKNVTDWLINQGIEVVYPMLSDFFLQAFVNMKASKDSHMSGRFLPTFAIDLIYKQVRRRIERVNAVCSKNFRYFTPFDDIFDKAAHASSAINLNAQFGEGWLIAGEVATLYSQGVSHVVSLQPFGCIANHIVEKGIENKLRKLYPQLNILSLDFDSSVSEVNITNRLLLFVNNLLKKVV